MKMNFKEAARKATVISELMENRVKVSVEDLISRYPGGVTLTEFDLLATPDGESTYPVFAIAEDDGVCFFGGVVLSNICKEWVNGYDGDIQAASADLKASGGVLVKMEKTKTRKGNKEVTKVTIL